MRINNITGTFRKNIVLLLWGAAVICLITSFLQITSDSIGKNTKKMERMLHQRERILDKHIEKAFSIPVDHWLDIKDLPEDMVIYRYVSDTLQSWVNLFPISNDDVDLIPHWYRIHDLTNTNIYNTPLAYLQEEIQYVNLGPSWYIIKIEKRDNIKIIAGIVIKTQYLTENSLLKNSNNPHLHLDNIYTTEPLYIDNSHIVHTLNGDAFFSIVETHPLLGHSQKMFLRWLAFIFTIFAILVYLSRNRNKKTFTLSLVGITILSICSFYITSNMPPVKDIFSPMLYADGRLFNSLAEIMNIHFYIFIYILAIFICRKPIIRNIKSSTTIAKRVKTGIFIALAIALVVYIHITLRSIIMNSTIILNLTRINQITIYSIIVYLLYAFLFVGLLFLLYIIVSTTTSKKGSILFSPKYILTYIFIISLYTVSTVISKGFLKECNTVRTLTGRLVLEQDMNLEIQLQMIEKAIIQDPLIKGLIGIRNTEEMILNRLMENYFWNIFTKYNIKITVCGEHDRIITDKYPRPVLCYNHFRSIINRYGIPLSESSAFYYLDYFRDRISYLGAFSIIRGGTRYDLYIELDSKDTKNYSGYPSLLVNNEDQEKVHVPFPYSYAKYYQGNLTTHAGNYNFAVGYNLNNIKRGFSYTAVDDHILFFNKYLNNNMIVISRPSRHFTQNLIYFSYIFLLYALILMGSSRVFRKQKHNSIFRISKGSLRMKLTLLVSLLLVLALVFMAFASVAFIYSYITENNRTTMERKLVSVQSSLSKMAQTSEKYDELNTAEMFQAMDLTSANMLVDINLFDPLGRLIRSTKPIVFNEYLVSTRMNPKAYNDLIFKKKMHSIQEENISQLEYYSLYTPIYNENGTLLAIANIPYFVTDSSFKYDAQTIIAAIINLYILLIIGSLLISFTVANSISKPLHTISKSMEEIDLKQKKEHIDYKGNDELGLLVRTYNQMIDDLDKSTKELAQSEREHAWREMARQIAYEIKNPLTPMRLSIQHLIRMKKTGTGNWEEKFDAVSQSLLEQIEILSNTASEFSSFAKFYVEEILPVDITEILRNQIALFDNNNESIEFIFDNKAGQVTCLARRGQITRVFVNLISNAVQAMDDIAGEKIRITLSYLDSENIRISIEDSGSGVSPENLNRLFTPNFTTKTSGTGLGLAICKNIVTEIHGTIHYERSEELGGANFIITLPLIKE